MTHPPTPHTREGIAPDVICCTRVKLGRSVGFITMGGPVYTIQGEEMERAYTFEWHPMWGPSRCNSVTGELLKNPFFPERSPFWALFDRWMLGGKRVDAFGRCILAPAPIPCESCAGLGCYKLPGSRKKYACKKCNGVITHRTPRPARVSSPEKGER